MAPYLLPASGQPATDEEAKCDSCDMGYHLNGIACDANSFTMSWTTSSAMEDITIPVAPDFTYSYTVDWGGSEADDTTVYSGDATHLLMLLQALIQ